MPNYLDRFETIKYQISEDGDLANLKNITQYIDIIADKLDIASYLYYDILDGERPDSVSRKLYGTEEYYWIFFLLNDHLRSGLKNWILTDIEFDKYIEKEYRQYWWCSGTAGGHPTNTIFADASQELNQIPLQEKYLPHLRITFESFGPGFNALYNFKPYDITSLKIKKYDHNRVGLIVHQPSDIQLISVGIDGVGDKTQLLKPAEITFINGTGAGSPYRTDEKGYKGIDIQQAEALLDDDYEDSLGNYNSLIFNMGQKYLGVNGNGIILKLEEVDRRPNILSGGNFIARPIEKLNENGETIINIKFSTGVTLQEFETFINALDVSNNNDHELSAFPYLNSKEQIIPEQVANGTQQLVTRLAITHDESYLGWEWQRLCNDLELIGWNMQAGPWVPEVPIGVDSLCQTEFNSFVDNSTSRAAVFFNNHLLFNFDSLEYATFEYFSEYKWSPNLNAPGLYSPDLIEDLDNLVIEKELLDFSDVILKETTAPTGILHFPRNTFGDVELNSNQNKRKLRVPRPEVVSQIARSYQELLNLTI